MSPYTRIADICIPKEAEVRAALEAIERGGKGISLVIDEVGRLIGTVTDGDVRRSILAGHSLQQRVSELLDHKRKEVYPEPITAPAGTLRDALLEVMVSKAVHQLPLLDGQGRVVDLVTMDDLERTAFPDVRAVIMAGGLGTRLFPLTKEIPKPMLPVAGRPMLEHIVQQLGCAGIRNVSISTFYKGETIKAHFGDGKAFGVDVSYITENEPRGTAGSLSLMPDANETLLVTNGDIITRLDYRKILAYHREHRALMTVGVRKYEVAVPFGVVETRGALVAKLTEKPTFAFFVNAGIYVLDPLVRSAIPQDGKFDMTELIQALVEDGNLVVSFPIVEYWLDVGRHGDYEKANEDHGAEEAL